MPCKRLILKVVSNLHFSSLNMKHILAVLLLAVFSATAWAQPTHRPLKSKGTIPKDFIELSSSKYEAEAEYLDSVSQRRRRKDKADFYLESNFIIDGLLRSGQVLFNDEVSQYINEIADTILKDDPELRSKLRFYTVKSPYVNAFATNQGMIFVNMGLLGQVENEAQLAYILCHEIIHYREQHAINSYVESMEITRAARRFQISFNDALLARSNYSQDLEMESDEEGLELYLKTNYDPTTVEDAFFVLEFSHLPFDEVVYKRAFLETKEVQLPEEYYLDEVSDIESMDEYRTEYSTHPNCQERRSKLVPMLRTASTEGKSKFLLGEDRFREMQRIARYEMTRYHIGERQYGAALYNAFLLRDKSPDDAYAAKTFLKALNFYVKYKNRNYTYGVLRSYYYVQGESQQLYYLLTKISAEELNTLAVAKAWELKERFPNETEIDRLANELIYELAFYHNNDFGKYRKLPDPADTVETKEPEKKELSKYDKIKKKIRREDYENDSTNVLYAFHNFLDDSAFVNRFNRIIKVAEEDKDSTEIDLDDWKKLLRKEKKKASEGASLGIDHILMLDPRYYKINRSIATDVKFEKTEKAQLEFLDHIQNVSGKVGLQVDVLSPMGLDSTQTDKFNDYAVLSDWVRERYEHVATLPNEVLPSTSEYTDSLIDVYGTRYMGIARVISVKNNDPQKYVKACLCCAGIVTAPLAVYYLVKPDVETYFTFDVIDLKTGKIMLQVEDVVPSKDHTYLVKSKLYDIFNQIKRSK